MGLYPLQKSVLIYPYEFKNEVEFISEIFDLRKFVRLMIVKEIDNALHLKKIFELI